MAFAQFPEQDPALSALLEEVYEPALDPTRWSKVVSLAAEVIGGSASLIYGLAPSPVHASWFGHRFPAEAMQTYAEYYQRTNLWAHEIDNRRIAVGEPVLTDALVDVRALERSEFFADYLRQLDIYRACTVLLHKDEHGSAGESHLCVYRSRSEPAFDERSVRVMAFLVPHLRRAQRIQRLLAEREGERDGAMSTIDHLSVGVIMLARDGRVIHLNPAAQGTVDQRDGLLIARGRLRAARDDESLQLERLVQAASGQGKMAPVGANVAVSRPSGKRALQLIFAPLGQVDREPNHGPGPAFTAVFVCGHERQMAASPELLSRRFGLSRAESRVALGLLEGKAPAEIGDDTGVSKNTVKSQLASLFAKTGTRRQAELMLALASVLGSVQHFE